MGYEFVIHLQQPTMEQVHTTNTATGNQNAVGIAKEIIYRESSGAL